MALYRQIGRTGGKVGDTTMNPTDPIVTSPPAGGPVAASPLAPPTTGVSPLVWAVGAVGAALLVNNLVDGGGDKPILAGSHKSLTPLLVIGGLGVVAWFLLKPSTAAAAVTPTGSAAGASSTTAATARQWMLTQFQASNPSNEAAFAAAVPNMTDDEAVAFQGVLQYIKQQGASFNGVLPAAMENTYNFVMQKYLIPGL